MKKKLLLQDIVDLIAQREGLTPDEADAFIRAFFDIVEQGLQEDKIVKIKGLGTFKLVAVSERESVNINTGERFQIEGHSKISFTPDNSMKELINRPFAHFEAVELSDETDAEEFNEVDKEVELEFDNNDYDTDEDEDDSTDQEEEKTEDEVNPTEDSTDEFITEDTSNQNIQPSADSDTATTIPLEIENTFENQEDGQLQDTSKDSKIEYEQETSSANLDRIETTSLENSIELDTQVPIEETQQENGMQENTADETPQPTTIAPTDLAENDNKRVTAKIRIDSNEDDNESTGTPQTEAVDKHNSEIGENTDNSEEEIFVTSPRPITSEHQGPHTSNTLGYAYIEVPSRRKVNWWKRGVLTFLFLLLLVISYFAGYYNLLCPCTLPQFEPHTTHQATSTQKSTPAPSQQKEDLDKSTEIPSVQQQSDKTDVTLLKTDQESLSETPVTPATELEEAGKKADSAVKAQSPSKTDKEKNESSSLKKKKEIQTKKETASKDNPSQSIRFHTVKQGDTLYKIARKYYGNEDAIHKIIKYNNLKDADHIQLGMTLKIPQ